jgi:hypothetical protein
LTLDFEGLAPRRIGLSLPLNARCHRQGLATL